MRAGQEGMKIEGVTGIRAWKKRDREGTGQRIF